MQNRGDELRNHTVQYFRKIRGVVIEGRHSLGNQKIPRTKQLATLKDFWRNNLELKSLLTSAISIIVS